VTHFYIVKEMTTPPRTEFFETFQSPFRKDPFSSGEINFKKTELSMEIGLSHKESFLKDEDLEPLEFVSAELDALDLSVIPVDSASMMKASVLDESHSVDNPNNLKPLVLENTGIRTKGWCKSCVCQGKEDFCRVM
jgi:hypothetical protein